MRRFSVFLSLFGLLIFTGACGLLGPQTSKTKLDKSSPMQPLQEAPDYSGYGADSVPQDVLTRFAPADISSKLRQEIELLLDVRSPGGGELSPDKKTIYFSWNVTGVSQVWKLDRSVGFPVQLTAGEDSASLVDLSPDGKTLIISRDQMGDEAFGLYWMDSAGGTLNKIFSQTKVVAHHSFVSDDSRYIYFQANDEKPDSYNFYRYRKQDGNLELVVSLDGVWSIGDHASDGRLLFKKLKGNINSEWFEWNPVSKDFKPVIGQNEEESYEVRFGPRDNSFYVRTSKKSEFKRLYLYENSELKEFAQKIEGEIAYFAVSRDRTRIVIQENRRGFFRLHSVLANDLSKLESIRNESLKQMFLSSLSADGNKMVISAGTGEVPRETYVYDWQTGRGEKWLSSSLPEINVSHFVTPTEENIDVRDGTSIPAFVWMPKGCTKSSCPVIVDFHGGPESQALPLFNSFYQMLVGRGYIVMSPNVRGSNGYGKSYLNADNGPKRLEVITDIEDVSKHLRSKWGSKRIGVMGGSYGGYSVFMAMTKFAGAYDAGVAIVGITSLKSFLNNTAPYRRALRITEYGDPEKDSEALEKLSPVSFASKAKDPLLIIHGASDPRVPVGEALQFHSLLNLDGARSLSELIIFSDEGHGIRKRKNKVVYLGHIIDFFGKNLK